MSLPIASRWFERRTIDEAITPLWEPHVDPWMRCNIWHVRGRGRDLLVDSGFGVASLSQAARDLFEHPLTAVATHAHADHVGSHHEFADRAIHPLEAELLKAPPYANLVAAKAYGPVGMAMLQRLGMPVPDGLLIDALPHAGYDPERDYAIPPSAPTRLLDESDMLDLGDRSFEVLHLPGHSPGSIGLWEKATGTLFSGDALYDGPLLDELERSSIPDYVRTMERLMELPVTVVHGGHEPSFGRERLKELCRAYLDRRKPAAAAQ